MTSRRTDDSMITHHAPAARLTAEMACGQGRHFNNDTLLRRFLDSIPSLLMVLNAHRQIIFSNRAVLEFLGTSSGPVLGTRPGEVFGCVNAHTLPGGCGTAEICRTCGAVNAILAAVDGKTEQREYRLTRSFEDYTESLDLLVDSTPLNHGGEQFIIFSVQDVSDQKRRSALEKIFFHDILNLAGGVKSFSQLLAENPDSSDAPEMVRLIESAASQVVDEINAQRMLLAAENGELKINTGLVNGQQIIESTAALYRRHPVAEQQTLRISSGPEDPWFTSDDTLVKRVIGNMVKNALEAGREGDVVTLSFLSGEDHVEFRVHNRASINREVQMQLFQRSFSTKGQGRGLGTYGMRLLAESFLRGRVGVESSPEDGTTFRITLPRTLSTLSSD